MNVGLCTIDVLSYKMMEQEAKKQVIFRTAGSFEKVFLSTIVIATKQQNYDDFMPSFPWHSNTYGQVDDRMKKAYIFSGVFYFSILSLFFCPLFLK